MIVHLDLATTGLSDHHQPHHEQGDPPLREGTWRQDGQTRRPAFPAGQGWAGLALFPPAILPPIVRISLGPPALGGSLAGPVVGVILSLVPLPMSSTLPVAFLSAAGHLPPGILLRTEPPTTLGTSLFFVSRHTNPPCLIWIRRQPDKTGWLFPEAGIHRFGWRGGGGKRVFRREKSKRRKNAPGGKEQGA